MTYEYLIARFNGNFTEAAYRLGVTVQTIWNWRKGGIPAKSQDLISYKLEMMKMDDAQAQELQNERYQRLMAAFFELVDKNVSTDALDTLRFETGLLPEDFKKLERGTT